MSRSISTWHAIVCASLWACSADFVPASSRSASHAVQPVCDPAEVRCTESGVRVCNGAGDAWVASACPVGQRCVADPCGDPLGCLGACVDLMCHPGERRCHADNTTVVLCNETGTGWCFFESCEQRHASGHASGVCSDGNCISVCTTDDKSYIGCEYFAVDLDNANVPCDRDPFGDLIFCDAASSQFAVVVSNPDPEHTAYVSITRGPLTPRASTPGACEIPELDPNHVAAAVIPPKGIEVFELPPRGANGTVKARLAYRVASNMPITVYQFNPLENVDVYSNDASLLLPTTSLGSDYLVMSREQTFDDLKGFITVVGIDSGGTEVTVTTTARTMAGPGISPLESGDSITVTLERYDVLNLESNRIGDDFTGSRVRASRPVAVFGGSEAANAPTTSRCDLESLTCEWNPQYTCACTDDDGPLCSEHAKCAIRGIITCCADHLEQQLLPISTWDTEYVAARSYPRSAESDVWRILANEGETRIRLDPPVAAVPVLEAGGWFEFETGADFLINANRPIMVGQFLAGQHAPTPGRQDGDADIGDPAFILAVPTAQYRESYVFLVPNKYAQDYVTIVTRASGNAWLDGTRVEELPDVLLASVSNSGWLAVRAPVGDGYHELFCPERCGVMVHGYDRYVSYGYPGGMNLVERDASPSTARWH